MSKLSDGGDAILNLAALLGPIIELAPELKRVGALDDYSKKLAGDVEALKKLQTTTKNNIEKSRTDFLTECDNKNQELKTREDAINKQKIDADAYLESKKKEASDIIAKTNDDRKVIINNANAEADQIVKAAKDKIKTQNAKIEENNLKLASINADIEARTNVLQDINSRLDALRTNV